VKVGDMIKYLEDDFGVVIEIMDDGHTQGQALVLWNDGKPQWIACVMCEVVSESR